MPKKSPFPKNTAPAEDEEMYEPTHPEEFMKDELDELGLNVEMSEPQLENIESLASGGTGEIFTARDDALGRVIALKTLRPEYQYNADQMERLVREAKAAAQLEHPNIVPIHSIGVSPSKGIYFTMKRLRGDSLRHIINQLAQRNPAYTKVYTSHVMLSIFMKICQGISYAHSKGIIHRDLKPENILVGNYGEVTVIDWGLVKKMGGGRTTHAPGSRVVMEQAARASNGETDKVDTAMFSASINLPRGNLTRNGQMNGTPRFMSPEQIFGDLEAIDTRTDIYALGVILYEMLTYENPFWDKYEEDDILNAVSRGQYRRPRQTERGREISPELEAICLKAMTLQAENRYQAVGEIIKDLVAHQEGRPVSSYKASIPVKCVKLFKRNPIKISMLLSVIVAILAYTAANSVIDSFYFKQTIRQVRINVAMGTNKLELLDKRLQASLAQDRTKPPSEQAGELTAEQYEVAQNEIDTLFNEASLLLSSIAGAKNRVSPAVQRWRERIMTVRINFCLRNGKINELRKLKGTLPAMFGDDLTVCSGNMRNLLDKMDAALAGVCSLKIQTVPAGAHLEIYQQRPSADGRRLVQGQLVNFDDLQTPAENINLPKGTYLIKIHMDGISDLTCPVTLHHGESKKMKIALPAKVPDGMAYVPGGACMVGGTLSPYKADYEPILEPFFISVHEVTNREYIEFWRTLKDRRQMNNYMSRVLLSSRSNLPRNAWDVQGKVIPEIDLDKPVVGIPREAAQAYCKWLGQKLGRICRLPNVEEWEAAARGTDGRFYPWGNVFVQEYTFTYENTEARKQHGLWARPGSFPQDVSPYGVYDMAGNVREWTETDFPDNDDSFPQIKGASSSTTKRYLPLERSDDTSVAPSDVGFRVVFPYLDTDTYQKLQE